MVVAGVLPRHALANVPNADVLTIISGVPARPARPSAARVRMRRGAERGFGPCRLSVRIYGERADTTGFYSKSWTFPEHIGTHMDAPGHFASGARLVDELTAEELLAPLVVVDIRNKADEDPNAMVEPEDLIAWERRHGRIPDGALVAMDSGWEERYGDPDAFLGGAGFPDLNFPGFSVDATEWLVAHRDPVGIGVDTPSLDPGNSSAFPVHFGFLATDRYGIENLANLGNAPVRNGTVGLAEIGRRSRAVLSGRRRPRVQRTRSRRRCRTGRSRVRCSGASGCPCVLTGPHPP